MPVLIHSARRGENPAVIFPSALLVEGSAPKPLLNAEFHSAAARSANAFCALCSVLGAWGITLFVTSIAFTNLPHRIAVKLLAKETSPDPFDVTTVVLL